MALAACVKAVLCGLSNGVRNAIKAVIGGYVVMLEAQVAGLRAQLIYLDFATIPISAANTAAQLVIQQVKAGANIVPLDLIGTCVDVGEINLSIQANLDILLADVNLVALDLQRMLSFRDEIEAAIADLEATINLYGEVIDLILSCQAVGLV